MKPQLFEHMRCISEKYFWWPDQALQPPPRAVDFTVPAGVRVVTVTGPNTGGKTASLKALGLAALMPKAGLFLPLESPAGKTKYPFPLSSQHYRVLLVNPLS